MFRAALESEGYAVEEAPDGRTALALARTLPLSMILQDLVLPDVDGFDLLKQLRAATINAPMPILAMSGFLSRLEEARLASVGFDDYLPKPVEISRLLQVAKQNVGHAAAS